MKTLASLLLASVALVGASAHAQDSQTQPLSRAQVVAELHAAQAAGQISTGRLDYPVAVKSTSSLTRAQVQTELQVARATGQISTGRLDYPVNVAPKSTLSRAQVVAQLKAAQAAGQIPHPET